MRSTLLLLSLLLLASEGQAQTIYPATSYTQPGALSFPCESGEDVTVVGPSNAELSAGDVLTGSDVRDVVIANGIVAVTYEVMTNAGATEQLGSHMLYRHNGSALVRAFDSDVGDLTFFAAPFAAPAVEAHVLVATNDVVEVSWVFDHDLDFPGQAGGCPCSAGYDTYGYVPSWWDTQAYGACTPANGCRCYLPGCGVVEQAHDGSAIRVDTTCTDPECYLRIRHVTVTKTIRVERCAEGYFVGLHSDPPLDPRLGYAGANSSSSGEREICDGGQSAVVFSESGVVMHAISQSGAYWMGTNDPESQSSSGQHANFPHDEPFDDPTWSADLPYYNRSGEVPFVRWIGMLHPLEVFTNSPNVVGWNRVHFVNAYPEPTGVPTRFQVFIGATPYISDLEDSCGGYRCFPGEPTGDLVELVQEHQQTSWPP